MISIASLLQPQNILLGIAATSKKRVFEQAAQSLANLSGVAKSVIFEALMQREKLGSTYLGHGIGLPHCRLEEIKTPTALFIRMNGYLDAAKGEEPIRSFLFVLAPADAAQDHLVILAQAAEMLGNEEELKKLRATTTAKAFSEVVQEWSEQHPPESYA